MARVDVEEPRWCSSGCIPGAVGGKALVEDEKECAYADEEDQGRTPLCSGCCAGGLPHGGPLLGSGTPPGTPPELCSGRSLQVVLVTAVWWVAAVYVTLMFKVATPALQPFTLTWLVNTTTGIIAFLISHLASWDAPPLPDMQWEEVGRLAALGLAQGCEYGCLNKSLQYLTVSERTMLSNMNVLLLMFAAWLCGLELLTCLRIIAGMLLAGGGMLQGLDSSHRSVSGASEEQATHCKGIAFLVTSLLLTAGKWLLVQLITQRSLPVSCLGRISKLQLTARVQPITGMVCLILAALFETRALSFEHLVGSGVLLNIPLIACGITVIQCSELKLVQLTSAVTCGVLMNLHHIPMVLAGVVFFHDRVDDVGLAGFACCLLGGLFYAAARRADQVAGEEATSPPPKLERAVSGPSRLPGQ